MPYKANKTSFKKGHEVSEEVRKKMSKSLMGIKRSEETKKKMSRSRKGKKRSPFSDEWKRNMSEAKKKMTKETREKMSKSAKGRKKSDETRRKMSEGKMGHIGLKGFKHTEESKRKISESRKGKKHSEKSKKIMRILAFEYAKKICGIICPRIGHNEKEILDKLEWELGYKIIRQYKVCGYFLDGYIMELKLAIEIDEIPKIREKDIERQKTIEEELNCKFIRIKDYD